MARGSLLLRSTMLRLDEEQRRVLVDKLSDVANLAAGAMVFGQFLADQRFSLGIAGVGLVVWGLLMGAALTLARRRRS